MKRFLIFAAFLLSQQIVNAHSLAIADSGFRAARGNYSQKTLKDTVLAMPVSAYSGSVFKLRLDSIQKEIPLDYNEYVQAYIDIYTRHKDEMSHVMGLSKYYFPIYEKIFREAGIPTEIKYLSIVESKLDPNAISRVGATGPWQFMATTAKIYGLNMNDYVDERRDPIQSAYAAAAYLKDAYQEFGDWLLAIASYNCGKSNVERAIVKAGAMDFWSIRQYLPVETRSYVPAYIAMSYVMNYARHHDITPDNWNFSARIDTVMVNRFVELNNVASALNVNINDLALLNPAYKRLIINGSTIAPRRMIIPHIAQEKYTPLYNVLNGIPNPVVSRPQPAQMFVTTAAAPASVKPVLTADIVQTGNVATAALVAVKPAIIKNADYHVVQEGETLEAIAADNGLDVREIKAWNRLQSNKVIAGKKLKLNPFAKTDRG
ncbi:MAG: LysM peptidoglycan-binding protein [Mucilaginibacter sp.]|uniref:lytic transglycosylase domain-containing protein n=1 Tax=Mucilaginibacter sp. TaxID=1882438 RepID=UPI00262EDA24|nr:lytic transglycosylase domain-containing protein [Mucilaginibacter sp.]MDB5003772.1 LysM peptidoglycan-binding protein [Mucilaginibacter sp.]